MNYKRLFCSIALLLTGIAAFAQSEVLTLYKKDGTTVQYSFVDKPVIYH